MTILHHFKYLGIERKEKIKEVTFPICWEYEYRLMEEQWIDIQENLLSKSPSPKVKIMKNKLGVRTQISQNTRTNRPFCYVSSMNHIFIIAFPLLN